MNRTTRKSAFRRPAMTAAFLAAMALSLSVWAYSPWETIYVTSHYDGNGALVGVEAVGACGFPLIGETGTSTTQRAYYCNQLNEIEMPF